MINEEKQNNRVFIKGEIVTEARYSYEVYGECFYEMDVLVKRLSGQADVLPVTVSERLIESHSLKVGSEISAIGQFRSYNKLIDNHSKLVLRVFVRSLCEPDENNPNQIEIEGFVCKPPIYRTTPFKREIADLLLAVNRAYNKSDYIPAIAWGRNARYASNFAVGDKIHIDGRIQSRIYQKQLEDGTVEERVAYEVSITRF